ncbi:MAG TPA: nucleoside triphosphate pyrophosphohydrolase [Chitinophagales bacterium]|nr:nucleoside triphosphate pyrophosphohydrolase [Chitinophagales bacterium]HRG27018.1 nucleoside triphosphate pyrophosphohydrolase [Chitinophagales bacterium]HRG85322.1 nucleoside triphosphate pyrophosphohydrolase [Chitinophagales bacterium]HRH52727.1 nucleoside triphosphate pyrophosphohydrolase [Chitinophagales bacterium]
MNISVEAKLEAFKRLLNIMDDLRSLCPWDKKQTIHTLRNLTIEETYELAESITANDWQGIKEELGDVLLHMIFYSKIGEEQEQFSIADVLNAQCEKLIHRHPHIYGDVKVKDEEEVKKNWEQLKLKEGKKSVLQGVPQGLPAMIKAFRIQEKAAQVKFEWENTQQVWNKVEEEMMELKEVFSTPDYDKLRLEDEFGDLMFSMINLSRFIHIDPENALERTNKKFIHRFQYIEAKALEQNKSLKEMTLEEMDALWNEAKLQG